MASENTCKIAENQDDAILVPLREKLEVHTT